MRQQSRLSLLLLLLTVITANIELDIFLPSLPQMQEFFGVDDKRIEGVLFFNFIGLSFSGLFSGYLSDLYGRKKMIIAGLGLFSISSLGCLLTSSFPLFLMFRFFQGIGCGAPATVSFAAICDIHSGQKAAQTISLFNGVVTATLVSAPLLGVVLMSWGGWKTTFVFVTLLGVISLLLMLLFFHESAFQNQMERGLLKHLWNVLKSVTFWSNGLIAIFMYASLIVFLSYFPLIIMKQMHLKEELYAFLQAFIMLSFVSGSVLATFLMKRWNLEQLATGGIYLIFIGCLGLLIGSSQWLLVTFSMAIFNLGAAFLIAIYSTRVLEAFSSRGLTSSLVGALRMLCAAAFIYFSGILYKGTFFPIAGVIFIASVISFFLFHITRKEIEST